MPIQSKSIWQQISNPREIYTDGYGAQREVSEPAIITLGRRAYDKIDIFLNGPETINIDGREVPVQQGAGLLEVLIDPAGVIGKADDVAKLAKNLNAAKDKWDALRNYKLHRKRLSTPSSKHHTFKNAERIFGDLSKLGPDDIDMSIDYINNKIDGDYNRYLDILWERGDLDGMKHPKVEYKYEELPF